MNIKKSKFKRFSCVICAALIGLLSVFAVIGFAPKKEKLSASAASVSDGYCYYRVTIPVGTTAYFTKLEYDCSISYLRDYQIQLMPWGSSISSVTIADNINFRIGDYFTYDSENNILTCIEMFNMYFTILLTNSYSIFGDGLDIVLAQTSENSTGYFNLFFSCTGYSPFRFCAGQTLTVVKYDETQTIDYNQKYLLVGKGNVSYDSSEEELQVKYDEGYNAGYAQGEKDFYLYGYMDGYSKGLDEGYDYGCEESAGALFDTCEIDIDNLDDNRDNLDNEKLSFKRVNAGTYEQAPLYLLSVDNSENDFKVGTRYEIEIKFSPYIKYTDSDGINVDKLYISAGKYGDYGSFGDPSERLSNLKSEVYTYGKGSGEEFSCNFVDTLVYIESNVFGSFKAVDYGDDLDVGADKDNVYMKSIRFDFVYDDEQIAVFTTEDLLIPYINAYEYTHMLAEREGNANGYKSGYTDGYNTGHTTGYTQGSTEGLQNAELGSFMNLITAVIDAPIKAFLGLLDFEILGMDMQKFFLSLLSAALIIAAYRLFSGGA